MAGASNVRVPMQRSPVCRRTGRRRTANLKDAPHEDASADAARCSLGGGGRGLLCAVSVGIVACLAEAKDYGSLEELLPADRRGSDYLICQSDSAPAILVQVLHSPLTLFSDLKKWGLSAPAFALYSAGKKQGAIRSGEGVGGDAMKEAWLIVSFSGQKGWDRITTGEPCSWAWHHPIKPLGPVDVPWLVVLQKRPERIRLDQDGLRLEFRGTSGTVAMMPLFGCKFLDPRATARWRSRLPREVMARVRLWTSILRRVPVNVVETHKVDPIADRVTMRQEFEYLSIKDDWKTPSRTIAPFPAVLGVAALYGFPFRLPAALADPDIPLLYGPYLYFDNVTSYEYSIDGTVRYVNKILVGENPDFGKHPDARRAQEELTKFFEAYPPLDYQWTGGYSRGWALSMIRLFYALGSVNDPEGKIRQKTLGIFKKTVEDNLLNWKSYTLVPFYDAALCGRYVAELICHHGEDSVKIVTSNPCGVWAYGELSGDWEALRPHWRKIRGMWHLPVRSGWMQVHPGSWAGQDVCRGAVQGTIGFARCAYKLGHYEDYRLACYLLAKTVAAQYAKEMLKKYWGERMSGYFNMDEPFLVWHPASPHGWGLLGKDSMYPHKNRGNHGRAWVETYMGANRDFWRIYRDFMPQVVPEVFDDLAGKCFPNYVKGGFILQPRAYVNKEPVEKLWEYYQETLKYHINRNKGEYTKKNPNDAWMARKTQSSLVQCLAAIVERAGEFVEKPIIEPSPASAAKTFEPSSPDVRPPGMKAFPCFPAGPGGADKPQAHEIRRDWPTLAWVGLRSPENYFLWRRQAEGLLFGAIKSGDGEEWLQRRTRGGGRLNWVATVSTYHEEDTVEPARRWNPRARTVEVAWTTDAPSDSVVEYWIHDLNARAPEKKQVREKKLVREHRISIGPLDPDDVYDFTVRSFDSAGRRYSSGTLPLRSDYVNIAEGCRYITAKRFPLVYWSEYWKWNKDKEKKERMENWLKYNRNAMQVQKKGKRAVLTNGSRRGGPFRSHADPHPEYVHWIVADLEKERVFDRVDLYHNSGWVPEGYRVEMGGDETNGFDDEAWKTVLVRVDDNRDAVSTHRFRPSKARYVRLRYTEPNPPGETVNRMELYELEVYGPAAQ